MAAKSSFPRARRLRGQRAFARVFGAKRSASNRWLVVYAAPNDLPYSRFGLVVGRKHGIAVRRNRLKRLLREAARLETAALPAGFDLICIPHPGEFAVLADYRRAVRTASLRAIARWPGPGS